MSGTKHDDQKSPMQLIPHFVMKGVADVLAFGAKKYDPWNWANGFEWGRLIGAVERHVGAFKDGEDIDPESNLCHIYHAMCGLMFLAAHYEKKLGTDDRHEWEEKE